MLKKVLSQELTSKPFDETKFQQHAEGAKGWAARVAVVLESVDNGILTKRL